MGSLKPFLAGNDIGDAALSFGLRFIRSPDVFPLCSSASSAVVFPGMESTAEDAKERGGGSSE